MPKNCVIICRSFEISRKDKIFTIKTAKLLGLGYPGGPIVEKYAENGDEKAFNFPKLQKGQPKLSHLQKLSKHRTELVLFRNT